MGGLNARGTAPSAASTYFNPSLLPRAKQGVTVGTLVVHDAVRIGVDARSRDVDVPSSAYDNVATDHPPVPTTWLEDGCAPAAGGACIREVPSAPRQEAGSSNDVRAYQVLGLVNHLFDDALTLGMYALVPVRSLMASHSFFVDEREQFATNSLHPELYADRLTPLSFAFGAGGRIFDGLSLGVSFTLGLNNKANARSYVGNSAALSDSLELATRVDVKATVSPHMGLSYEPNERVSLSLTLHSPQGVTTETAFSIYLPNGDLQHARRTARQGDLPWTSALAARYLIARRGNRTWNLAGTLSYERWSQYRNRQNERPSPGYAWRDTLTSTLGVHFARARFGAYCDASYRPSPVPTQSGRTNYADNDRITTMLGISYELPIQSVGVALRFGALAQVHALPERHHRKRDPHQPSTTPASELVLDEWPDDSVDISTGRTIAEAHGLQTNNPGWPGFRSRGYIVTAALQVSLFY